MKRSVRVLVWTTFIAILGSTALWSAPKVKESVLPASPGYPFRPRISGEWILDVRTKDDKACASTPFAVIASNVVTGQAYTVFTQSPGWCDIGDRFGAWTGDRSKIEGFCSLKGDRSGSNNKSNLILIDITNWQYYTPVLKNGPAFAPVSRGNYVAYEGANSGIYLIDLQTGDEVRVSSADTQARNPNMSGDLLIWEVFKDKRQVHGYRLSTKQTFVITDDAGAEHCGPYTDGKTIVWWDQSSGQQVTVYDVATKQRRTIPGGYYADVSDGIVVYLKNLEDGKSAVFGYDLAASQEFRISTESGCCGPAISGNRVIWTNGQKTMCAELDRGKGKTK
jgi:hypothetical protein